MESMRPQEFLEMSYITSCPPFNPMLLMATNYKAVVYFSRDNAVDDVRSNMCQLVKLFLLAISQMVFIVRIVRGGNGQKSASP